MTIERIRDLCQLAQEALQARSGPSPRAGSDPSESREPLHPLALMEEAVRLAQEKCGLGTYPHVQALVIYGAVLAAVGNAPSAGEIFTTVEPLAMALSSTDPERSLHVLGQIARWYAHQGEGDRAMDLLDQLINLSQDVYGADHPRTLLLQSEGQHWLYGMGDRPLGLWHF